MEDQEDVLRGHQSGQDLGVPLPSDPLTEVGLVVCCQVVGTQPHSGDTGTTSE